MDRRWIAVAAALFAFGLVAWWAMRPGDPAPGNPAPDLAVAESPKPKAPRRKVQAPPPEEPPPDADFAAARANQEREAKDMYRVYMENLGFGAYMTCRIEGVPDLTPGQIEVRNGEQYTRSQVQVVDGAIRVAVGWTDGDVKLKLKGFSETTTSWSGASREGDVACGPLTPARAYARASGRVTDANGVLVANGTVEGCGGDGAIDPSGTFAVDGEPGDCTLVPKAKIGDWEVTGAELDVTLEADVDNPVDLEFEPEQARLSQGEQGDWVLGFDDRGVRVLQKPADETRVGQGEFLSQIGDVTVRGSDPLTQLEAAQALLDKSTKVEKGSRKPDRQ
jgi:hypothetical protein